MIRRDPAHFGRTLAIATVVLLAIVAFGEVTQAQEVRVARASFCGGEASYQRGDDPYGSWYALGPNTPLVAGDAVFVPAGERAELDLGMGTVAHLDEKSHIELLNLAPDVVQIGLWSGALDLRVRPIPKGAAVEVDTPYGATTVLQPGTYRFWLSGDSADFAAAAGRLSVTVGGEDLEVGEGDDLEITGTSSPAFAYYDLPVVVRFDLWSDERDQRYDRAEGPRFANPAVMGLEDLDGAGEWQEDEDYGALWVPYVEPDWVPYRNGRWIWQDPYGWTWVSYEPWGWAPYHYGRWVYADSGWAWVPPPPGVRPSRAGSIILPAYAPALVGFLGGPDWSLTGTGQQAVGWVPLAPSEPYVGPWASGSAPPSAWVNASVKGAVSVVLAEDFAARPVKVLAADSAELKKAPVLGGQPRGISPTKASLTAYPMRTTGRAAPEESAKVLVARLLPPGRPASFDRKLKDIKDSGRPFATAPEPGVGKPFARGSAAPAGIRSAWTLDAKGETLKRKEAAPGKTQRHTDLAPRPVDSAGAPGQPKPVLDRSPEGLPAARPAAPPSEPGSAHAAKPETPAEKTAAAAGTRAAEAKPADAKGQEPAPTLTPNKKD